jgi:uncharacterized protein YacL
MTSELAFRLIGMMLLALIGARVGVQAAVPPISAEVSTLTFALVGALTGLILTPYFTTRPAQAAREVIRKMSAEALVTSIIGLIGGLIIAALFSVPLSFLPAPFSEWTPTIVAVIAAYVSILVFSYRAKDVINLARSLFRGEVAPDGTPAQERIAAPETIILIDSSVIIDGRIVDIAKTGFLFGTIVVPNFVLRELQHIADESDPMRRNRGRRGLEVLETLQREPKVSIRVEDFEVDTVRAVDDKLIVLSKRLSAPLLTTDYTLNRTASLQGVEVLNINELANAVKTRILPNEVIAIHVSAEGREPDQGIGYLEDGTMVVVEGGKRFLDRTIYVMITRTIQTVAGKMYFSRPVDEKEAPKDRK